jgi:uncharacterized DUF497 family protein
MFEWDPNKRDANITKHGLDLALGATVFDGRAVYTYPSPRGEEQRFVTVGLMSGVMGGLGTAGGSNTADLVKEG